MGASLCAATGLGELICPDQQAYVATAIALGRDRTKLQNLRRQLREHQSELPLFQTGAWVKHLETLLEQLIAMQHAA
jgi:predicted O-linked N-acetylglucosamine transferase (SPINDLY family)